MKINRSANESAADHRVNSLSRTLLLRKLAAAVRLSVPACILMAASLASAGQPFAPTSSAAASQITAYSQAQNAVSTTTASNQAMMNRLINQINQRQFQSQINAAQLNAQRPIYVPQQITVRPAK